MFLYPTLAANFGNGCNAGSKTKYIIHPLLGGGGVSTVF